MPKLRQPLVSVPFRGYVVVIRLLCTAIVPIAALFPSPFGVM